MGCIFIWIPFQFRPCVQCLRIRYLSFVLHCVKLRRRQLHILSPSVHAEGSEVAVWGNPGEGAIRNIPVQRENRIEGIEEHYVVGGDVEEEEKKRS